MKLSDALGHLRGLSDQTHKFWGYYQAVTVAAIAFAWGSSKPPPELIHGLVGAYAIFAVLNCRLVVSSQKSALTVWMAIQQYEPLADEAINPTLSSISSLNEPDNPILIGFMHVVLSGSAAFAIFARTGHLVCPPAN